MSAHCWCGRPVLPTSLDGLHCSEHDNPDPVDDCDTCGGTGVRSVTRPGVLGMDEDIDGDCDHCFGSGAVL